MASRAHRTAHRSVTRTASAVAAGALLLACQPGPDIGEGDLDLRQWTESDDPAADVTLPDGRTVWITAEAVTLREDVEVALHPAPDGAQEVVVTSPESIVVPDERSRTDERDPGLGLMVGPLDRMAEDPDVVFAEPPSSYWLSVGPGEATPVGVVSAELDTVCIEVESWSSFRYSDEESTVPSGLGLWTPVGHSEREAELACGGPAPDAPLRDRYDWAAEQVGTDMLEQSQERLNVSASLDRAEGLAIIEVDSYFPVEIQAPTGGATLAGVAGSGIWLWDDGSDLLSAEHGLTLRIPLDEDSPLWWEFRAREVCLAVHRAEADEAESHCSPL
ncbi:hypothetical protein EDD31_0154 [Bogoriella caseilytica]|uniref:Uncharacterized protein n=2 Tax=Bogoriella caseilytica TaxID=56055 RepID=A0A3N2B969_9MICO|nr:hypothetical protein EDD31_0154 [Bogoriella caseilytica]